MVVLIKKKHIPYRIYAQTNHRDKCLILSYQAARI